MPDRTRTHEDAPNWTRAVRRHVHAPTHEWFAPCAPGLEELLAAEAREVGLDGVQAVPGGVNFRGRLADGYAANLRLRLANRVLARVASFPARAPEDVVREARAVAWEAWLPLGQPLRTEVAIHASRIPSAGLLATKVLDAIRDRLQAANVAMPSVALRPSGSSQALMLRLEHNRLTLSLDASGEHLHRRGYRIAVTPAPIRETLAAAILRFAAFSGTEPLVDPMCGSGTFPIEADWIATNTSPGMARPFAFQQWPSYRPATWDWLRRRAIDARRPSARPILASDRDPAALRAARANASRAGAASDIIFLERDFEDLAPRDLSEGTSAPGLVVINPPYGLRMEAGADPGATLRKVGRRLAAAWRGWRFALVLADEHLLPVLDLPVAASLKVPHGGRQVAIVRGRVP